MPEHKPTAGIEVEKQWCPDHCPVTFRPFFMWIEHPELGHVPIYGGPFDSYTIPYPEIPDVKQDPYHTIELTTHRYDHDLGGWREAENTSLRVVSEDHLNDLEGKIEAAADQIAEKDAQILALREALAANRENTCELLAERDWWKDETRCEYAERYVTMQNDVKAADAALSAPPPPVCSLEDVRPLVEAIESLTHVRAQHHEWHGAPDMRPYIIHQDRLTSAKEALSQFLTQHPLL